MSLAGETLNIFLLTIISNINIVFTKKKKNVVIYKNIVIIYFLHTLHRKYYIEINIAINFQIRW